jgi:hypothetical protein
LSSGTANPKISKQKLQPKTASQKLQPKNYNPKIGTPKIGNKKTMPKNPLGCLKVIMVEASPPRIKLPVQIKTGPLKSRFVFKAGAVVFGAKRQGRGATHICDKPPAKLS